jgi:hypothetical protein
MSDTIINNILNICYSLNWDEESKMPYEGQFIGE